MIVDIFKIIRPEVFCKIAAFKNFVKFKEKHLYWSLFVNNIAGLAYDFITKDTSAKVQNF